MMGDNQWTDDEAFRQKVRAEVQRELDTKKQYSMGQELGLMGGGLVGGGLGFLAIEPARVIGEHLNEQVQFNNTVDQNKTLQILRILRKIHLGEATFSDFGDNEKVLREIYADPEFRQTIGDGYKYRQAIEHLSKGRIYRFPNQNPSKMQLAKELGAKLKATPLLPTGGRGSLLNAATHPLVAGGVIGGGLLAEQIYRYHNKKEM